MPASIPAWAAWLIGLALGAAFFALGNPLPLLAVVALLRGHGRQPLPLWRRTKRKEKPCEH